MAALPVRLIGFRRYWLVAAFCLSGTHAHADEAPDMSGAELFRVFCASCHGKHATGEGPVAPALNVRVPDLTRLAWRDGGEFPREDVRRAIDGRLEYRAHGSREMPVWGIRFYDLSSSEPQAERAKVDAMIDKLVDYLESVQDGAE